MTFNKKSIVLIFIICALLNSLVGFSQIETEENELEIENGIITDDPTIQNPNEQPLQDRTSLYNINKINETELFSLQLLTPLQINQFLLYKKTMGPFINLLELQAIPYWDTQTIKKIIPNLYIESDQQLIPTLKQQIKTGEHFILYRTGWTNSGIQKGSSTIFNGNTDTEKGYKQLIRYSFKNNHAMRWGATIEKDAGEQNWADHMSGYAMIKDKGIVKTMIVGDYLLCIGQGLMQWQGYAFGKSNNIIGGYRQGEIIRPHTGSDENRYHRGIGMTLAKKNGELTLFAGREKIDANVITDSSLTSPFKYISAFQTSGLHYSASTITDKNAVMEKIMGGRASVYFHEFKIGINHLYTVFDYPIKKRNIPYNFFAINSNHWQNSSADFSLNTKKAFLFGEIAIDQQVNKAINIGLIKSIDAKLDVFFLYRNINKAFRSIQSNAMTQNTEANNERGLYTCLNLQLDAKNKIDGYIDSYINSWPGYFCDGTRRGNNLAIQYTWKPNKKTECYLRYQQDKKTENGRLESDKTNRLLFTYLSKIRMNLSFMPSPSITIRERVELSRYTKEYQQAELGFLSYVEVIFKPLLKPFTISLRTSIFETGGYHSRIYSYERDVLSYYSIPALYDKGMRNYVVAEYKLTKQLTIWLKWAFSKSAADGINYGNSSFGYLLKKEGRIQVIWHL